MSCDNVPTTAEIEQAKKDVNDFNTFMTSTSNTFVDSRGILRLTLQGAIDEFGFGITPFTFTEGGTLLDRKLLVSNDPVDGFLYRYVGTGVFPIIVTAGTNPVGDPNWEAFTATSAEFISNANGGSVQDFIDQTESNINLVQNDIVITNTNVSSNTSRISDLEADDPLGKLSLHDNDPLAHPQLSAFITAEADRAEAAADAATVNADVYPTIAAGLLATIDGQQFQVIDGYELVRYRRDSATTYTEMLRTLTTEGIEREMERANDVVDHMASKIDLTQPPEFGWINGRAYGSLSSGAGVVVMSIPAATSKIVSKIVILAGAVLGDIEVATYTKSGDTFTRTGTVVTVKTEHPNAENIFYSDKFTPFTVNAGDYVGFSMPSDGMVRYENTPAIPLGYFFGSYANKLSFTDTAATFTVAFQIGLYDEELRDEIKFIDELDLSRRALDRLLNDITTDSIGRMGADSNLVGAGTQFSGTFFVGYSAENSGVVNRVNVGIAGNGSVTVATYEKTDTLQLTPREHVVIPVVNGANSIEIELDILQGQYIGVIVPAPLKITTELTTVGHDGYLSSVSQTFGAVTVSSMNPTFDRRIDVGYDVVFTSVDADNKAWSGETLVTFGDSITWYDGKPFNSSHVESGQIAVGYQEYLKDKLGCAIDNQGASGFTLPEIYTTRVLPFDFSSTFAVTITSGANDHRKAVSPGTVMPIGSAFNSATYAGAMQLSIEKIINANKDTKIFLITPIRGYFFESGTADVPGPYNGEMEISRDYINVMKQVGEIYGIPVIDWYDSTSLNILNYLHWLGDNPAVFTAYSLHPKNAFFEVMGKIAAEQINIYR